MRYPLIDSQGNFGSPGNDPPAAMRYTECRLAPLAMEMLRDIDKETVDFRPNYDGRSAEPVVLPARFPNLLVNGSEGIAVGMATKIPPHNLREVAEGVRWYLDNFDASDEDLLEALIERVKGPDFPTRGLIVGPPRHPGRLPDRPRLDHHARRGQGRGGRPRPGHAGRDRAAVPGQPGQPGPEDRRAGQGRPDQRYRRHARRDQPAHRPAPGHRAQAGRDPQGRAEQPVQAHPAAGHVRRQHDGAGRQRAADPAPGPVHPLLGRAPDRGHRPAYPVPAAQGAGAGAHPERAAQGDRPDRRGHRPDPGQRSRPPRPSRA